MKLVSGKSIAAALFAVTLMGTASASTWNTFAQAFNSETALYYFDADTVQKQGENVTLWVKYVKTVVPDKDGSWSTASKYVITCGKRKAQVLTSSIYDKNTKFIKTYSTPEAPSDIVPDSILEAIYVAVCTPNFPKDKSGKLYFPIKNNDIYSHTADFMNYLETQKDTAPQ